MISSVVIAINSIVIAISSVVMLVSGRPDVGLDLIRRHLRGLPMILLGGKVTSEQSQSDSPSG